MELEDHGFVRQTVQLQAGELVHGETESYAVEDGRIIANFETYSASP